jgi:hypothetical protein
MSKSAVLARIRNGELEAVRIGRYHRVLRRSVWDYQARAELERG